MDDSDYSGAMAPVYAAAAAELVRSLKQSTTEADGLHDALDAIGALWNVAQLLQDLPRALQQMSMWLDREAAQGRVVAYCGPYANRPDQAIEVVNAYVVAVRGALAQAATGMHAVRTITEMLTTPDAA
jgi:hypothetical protein